MYIACGIKIKLIEIINQSSARDHNECKCCYRYT
jgi:tryptophanyl-tRNA synthetase